MEPPAVISNFVQACSEPDPEGAAACVAPDATYVLPGGRTLPPGPDGARAFAAQHAQSDGRKPSVELISVVSAGGGRWVAALRFVSREVATGDTLYEMKVGGVITLRDDAISALVAFPSAAEAEASLH